MFGRRRRALQRRIDRLEGDLRLERRHAREMEVESDRLYDALVEARRVVLDAIGTYGAEPAPPPLCPVCFKPVEVGDGVA